MPRSDTSFTAVDTPHAHARSRVSCRCSLITPSMVVRDTAQESRSQSVIPIGIDREEDTASVSSVPTMSATAEREAAESSHDDHWVRRSNILHGIALQGLVAGGGQTIPFSPRSAAIPLGPISVEEVPVTDVSVTSTTSTSEAALMRLGFAHVAASHAARCASLLGEDVSTTRIAQAIHVTCRRVYARALVRTEIDDLSPNPQLVADIEKALSFPDQSRQIGALRSVWRRWGSVIATRIEIGCALVSTSVFEKSSYIPTLGIVSNPPEPSALLAAEKYVHNALRVRISKQVPGTTDKDKACYEDLARQLSFKAVGGSHQMQIEGTPDHTSLSDPLLWTVIGVNGVVPTLDLLRAEHSDMYARCLDLISVLETKAAPALPAPPILAFSGRLTTYKHHASDIYQMNGFVQIDLPRTFDFYSNFTLSGWIYSCILPNHAAAISLECAEVHEALLQIGEWDKNKILRVSHHSPNDLDGVARSWLSSMRTYEFRRWYHVAVTRSSDSLTLYLDGVLQEREKIPLSQVPLSRMRLCIGRSAWKHKRSNQWDGSVENVKLWERVLDEDELDQEASKSNTPEPAAWSGPRYA